MDENNGHLKRLQRVLAVVQKRPDGTTPTESRLAEAVAHLNRLHGRPPLPPERRWRPTIPDLTLSDLEHDRRDGVPVNPIAAVRLYGEYCLLCGDEAREIADALTALWRDRPLAQPSEAEWPLIFEGFRRVRRTQGVTEP